MRRGRAATRKVDLDDDGPSDFEEIESDVETSELGEWLSHQNFSTRQLIPRESMVQKFMPPGTLRDLWEHYRSTQSLLGSISVGYFDLFQNSSDMF